MARALAVGSLLFLIGCTTGPRVGTESRPAVGATPLPQERNMSASIKRVDGKVWIEHVPVLAWGRSSDTTFAGALEAALAVTDHPYTAAQIMGYCGLAFRVRWGPRDKGWCPSIPVGEFPEEVAAVSRATGWQVRSINHMTEEQNPRMGRYADDIVRSIDAGLPVVGYLTVKDLNVGVAYGYEGTGSDRKFIWRSYWTAEKPTAVPATDTGSWVLILERHRPPPAHRQRLPDALAIAVRNWHRQPTDGAKGYHYLWGEQALTVWHNDVRDATTFSEEQRNGLLFANWWCYSILADARRHAAAFLGQNAGVLPADAAAHLKHAADLYQQEADLLAGPFQTKDAFLGPWTGKQTKDWTPEARKRECRILAEALALERQVIAAIEDVLRLAQ